MVNYLDYQISCSNSEFLLKDGKYIRYEKGKNTPESIKSREYFKIDKIIKEDIYDYVNNIDTYLNEAINFL